MKVFVLVILYYLASCGTHSQQYIANYQVAKETVIRSIPVQYIDKARQDFVIAYQHTSHGTHVTYGLLGLQDYKIGDRQLFAVSRNSEETNMLALYDYAIEAYATPGEDATDLSSKQETAFVQATRNFLDDQINASVNVVMWSWCNIEDHDVSGNYLPGMQTLINEYGSGGTKIGSGEGQRSKSVHFIFMTGHANLDNNIGDGKPKNQADLITNYCQLKGYYCLDYYSIDSYCMKDIYYEDAGDDGDSRLYGGNYYHDFENASVLGQDYYENKLIPDGEVEYGSHTTQHITSNRKAYAMWWILARLAGWDGITTAVGDETKQIELEYDVTHQRLMLDESLIGRSQLFIYNLTGQCISQQLVSDSHMSVRHLPNGLYIASLAVDGKTFVKKIVVQK